MKLTVNKMDACKREMKFEIPKERVKQTLEEVYKDITKVAKVKGFRQGMAPRHILEAEYGALAREETLKKIIPAVYREGLEQEKIAPIDMPEIQDVNYKDGVVTFTAHVEIKPEVALKNYRKISVQRKGSEVTEEEITKALDYFKKSHGKEEGFQIDDQFVRGLGYPDFTSFKQSLVREMERDKDQQNRADIERQIEEALLKETKLTLPQSLVKKQLEHRLEDAKERLRSRKVSEEEIEKREEEFRKELQPIVEKDLKLFLIFDKIAGLENIMVKEEESLPAKVMEFLLKEAEWKT